MLKRPQDGRPKFPIFFKNRPKNPVITVFGPRCLLEASKSLPRASRELPKSRPRALKRPSAAFKNPVRPPRGLQVHTLWINLPGVPKPSRNGGGGGARPVGVFDILNISMIYYYIIDMCTCIMTPWRRRTLNNEVK